MTLPDEGVEYSVPYKRHNGGLSRFTVHPSVTVFYPPRSASPVSDDRAGRSDAARFEKSGHRDAPVSIVHLHNDESRRRYVRMHFASNEYRTKRTCL